ncbi:MAG: hypothetical protein QOH63_1404 [Acidobacteriota bacterium]|jgi:hypothetical protein|nr:hypothetical protein [Acidobacteriota bacterium]
MKKTKKHTNTHFDNLIDLRERNPQAYARLGERPRQAVEGYEAGRLAASFEYRPGTERLIELSERLPQVYARFSSATKEMVEDYLGKKRASQLVDELRSHTQD